MSSLVMDVLTPVLTDLGAEADPECWVIWGDEPAVRYSVLAPAPVGLITAVVRPASAGEGIRAVAKLTRWSKLTVSEPSVESVDGHRLTAVQVETQVLKGVDEEADRICAFVLILLAGIDGRAPQAIPIGLGPAAS